jgi:hypothetical protein
MSTARDKSTNSSNFRERRTYKTAYELKARKAREYCQQLRTAPQAEKKNKKKKKKKKKKNDA